MFWLGVFAGAVGLVFLVICWFCYEERQMSKRHELRRIIEEIVDDYMNRQIDATKIKISTPQTFTRKAGEEK